MPKLKKLFKVLPPMIWLYLGTALLASCGLFERNESVQTYQTMLTGNFLPLMLVFFLINCDLRKIIKIGPKMLLAFFCATFTIILGFAVSFALFKGFLPADSWKVIGAASGAWIGGTANMLAAAAAVGVTEEGLSYAILMGSVSFALWMSILLGTSSLGAKFNRWTKADTRVIDEVKAKLDQENAEKKEAATFTEIMALLAIGFGIAWFSNAVGSKLPTIGNVINGSAWTILIASTIGILLAMTPVSKMKGATLVGNVFMYLLLAATGAKANFFTLTDAPIYLLMGLVILVVHAVTFIGFAKLFKMDLFTCEVASVANIGGVTSGPIVAGVHNPALIPIGILMGLLGNLVGTYFALLICQILSVVA